VITQLESFDRTEREPELAIADFEKFVDSPPLNPVTEFPRHESLAAESTSSRETAGEVAGEAPVIDAWATPNAGWATGSGAVEEAVEPLPPALDVETIDLSSLIDPPGAADLDSLRGGMPEELGRSAEFVIDDSAYAATEDHGISDKAGLAEPSAPFEGKWSPSGHDVDSESVPGSAAEQPDALEIAPVSEEAPSLERTLDSENATHAAGSRSNAPAADASREPVDVVESGSLIATEVERQDSTLGPLHGEAEGDGRTAAVEFLDDALSEFQLADEERRAPPTPIPGLEVALAEERDVLAGAEASGGSYEAPTLTPAGPIVALRANDDPRSEETVMGEGQGHADPLTGRSGDTAALSPESEMLETSHSGADFPAGHGAAIDLADAWAVGPAHSSDLRIVEEHWQTAAPGSVTERVTEQEGEADLRNFLSRQLVREHVVATLEAVARRVREGEIVAVTDAHATPAAVLASVLASLLSTRT